MKCLFKPFVALFLLLLLPACASVDPVPKETADKIRRISVIAAFSDTLSYEHIGATIFNNSSAVYRPSWSHNEFAMELLRQRLPKHYELVEAVTVKPANPRMTTAELVGQTLADRTVDAIIVLTEAWIGDPFFATVIDLHGIGLVHRTDLFNTRTTLAFAGYRVEVLDGTSLKPLSSSLAQLVFRKNDLPIPAGATLANRQRSDFMGPFKWHERFEDYSPEMLQTIEKSVSVVIQGSLHATLKEMNIKVD